MVNLPCIFLFAVSLNPADGFEESDPDKTTGINFLPKVGYFVADNLAVGLEIGRASCRERV